MALGRIPQISTDQQETLVSIPQEIFRLRNLDVMYIVSQIHAGFLFEFGRQVAAADKQRIGDFFGFNGIRQVVSYVACHTGHEFGLISLIPQCFYQLRVMFYHVELQILDLLYVI